MTTLGWEHSLRVGVMRSRHISQPQWACRCVISFSLAFSFCCCCCLVAQAATPPVAVLLLLRLDPARSLSRKLRLLQVANHTITELNQGAFTHNIIAVVVVPHKQI